MSAYYEASFEHIGLDGQINRHQIQFQLDGAAAKFDAAEVGVAWLRAIAWFRDRQCQVPDWFGTLLAVTLSPMVIPSIDSSGHLNGSARGFALKEWKLDYPWSPENT
jgi:hypothetical protein